MRFSVFSMFDPLQVEQTYEMQVFSAFLYCAIACFFWKKCVVTPSDYVPSRIGITLSLLFLIFAITPTYTGDFWGYKPLVEYFDPTYGTWHLEDFYQNLLRLIGPNYLLFRLLVWGGAELLFLISCSRFKIDPYKTLFLLFCLFVTKFVYARATLAMAVYFFGISFVCKPIQRKKVVSIIIGIGIVLFSTFFHRSMIALVLLTPIIFVPLSKKSVILILLIIPLLTLLIRNILVDFSHLIVEEDRVYDMQTYATTKDFGSIVAKTDLLFWWGCLSFFVSFFMISFLVLNKNKKMLVPNASEILYRLVFGITIFSYCCYFIRPENPTLFYRYLYMTMIPLVIILEDLRKNRIIKQKTFIIIAIIGLTPELATFFYRVFVKFTPIGYH